MRIKRQCYFAILALFVAQGVLLAQVETARITGTVSDATGAVIPGAQVVVTHLQTNREFRTQTTPSGRYDAPNLPIGDYQVVVESPGFKRTVRTGINLEVQETAVLDFAMEVGAVTESIEVVSDTPLLQTVEASQGEVIDNKKIVDLPLNGRDYIQLALLSSGAVQPVGGRAGGFSASGMRTTQNNYLLDGIDNNNLQSATQGRRAETVKPSIDAVQEFKVVTNMYSAEYGRAAGGVVNLTLKSGSNEFHGSVFAFLRNEVLDAKNFFDSPTADKPPFKRSQFGFAVGGPIIKNKTFFFGDYEGTRIRESRTVNNTIPTPAMRAGDFSGVSETIFDPDTLQSVDGQFVRSPFPGNMIPSARFDPVSSVAKDWYPNPQNASLTQNFLFNPPAEEDRNRFDIRIDHNFSSSDNVFFRYSQDKRDLPGSPSLPGEAIGGGNAADFVHTGNNMVIAWNHVFSPTILTSNRVGWNRMDTARTAPFDRNVNAELGITGVDQQMAGAPIFNISGVTNLGLGPNIPNLAESQTRQFKNDTTFIKGRHTIKVGADLQFLANDLENPKRRIGDFRFNGNFTRNPNGNAGGDPFADFLLGIPVESRVARGVLMNLRSPFYHFYAQDEWKVTPRLTLNFGVRYEVFRPWVEDTRDAWVQYDIESNPSHPQLVVAQNTGSRFDRALVETDWNNFGPRLGMAFRATSKTVIRAGYGLFYAAWDPPGGGKLLASNMPFEVRSWRSTDSIHPDILLSSGVPNSPVEDSFDPVDATNVSVSNIESNRTWPGSQQWNLTIQHQLAQDWSWEVGYYGAKAEHLVRKYDANYSPPGPGNINSKRQWTSVIFPGTNIVNSPLGEAFRHQFDGNSQFHSVQTKLEKRFSKGFTTLVSYIFSRNIGDVCGQAGSGNAGGCGIQDPTNLSLMKSLDNQHRKHRFVANAIWDLPFGRNRMWGSNWNPVVDAVAGGWTVASIITLTSGEPFSPTVRGNPANHNLDNRPNVVGNPILPGDERTLDRWFNVDAFEPNAQYEFGNAGRNILLSPDRRNWDFSVYKRFYFSESKFLQFRFEAFNFTNTPAFGNPNAQVGNRNIGRITGAGRPRNLQFGLKFIF